MDGIELIRRVRADPRSPTSRSSSSRRTGRRLEAGGGGGGRDAYLVKREFEEAALLQAVLRCSARAGGRGALTPASALLVGRQRDLHRHDVRPPRPGTVGRGRGRRARRARGRRDGEAPAARRRLHGRLHAGPRRGRGRRAHHGRGGDADRDGDRRRLVGDRGDLLPRRRRGGPRRPREARGAGRDEALLDRLVAPRRGPGPPDARRRRARRAGDAPPPPGATGAPAPAAVPPTLDLLAVPAGRIHAWGSPSRPGGPPVLEAALRDPARDYPSPS